MFATKKSQELELQRDNPCHAKLSQANFVVRPCSYIFVDVFTLFATIKLQPAGRKKSSSDIAKKKEKANPFIDLPLKKFLSMYLLLLFKYYWRMTAI